MFLRKFFYANAALCTLLCSLTLPIEAQDKDLKALEVIGKIQECLNFIEEDTPESLSTAITNCPPVLEIARASGDKDTETTALIIIGRLYSATNQKEKAYEYLNQALTLARTQNNKKDQVSALLLLGTIEHHKSENAKATETLSTALALATELNDGGNKTTILHQLGSVYFALGESQKAVELFRRRIEIDRESGKPEKAATSLHYLGWLFRENGDYENALKYFQEALALDKSIKGREENVLMTMRNLADAYSLVGEKQKALTLLNEAGALAKSKQDAIEQAAVLSEIGKIHRAAGDYQKAIETFQQELKIVAEAKQPRAVRQAWFDLAQTYEEMGDVQQAILLYNMVLQASSKSGDGELMVASFPFLGQTLARFGQQETAIEAGEHILDLARKFNNPRLEAAMLENIGDVYSKTGDRQKQLEYLEKALLLHRQQNNKGSESIIRTKIGRVYFQLGDKQKALEQNELSLKLLNEGGSPEARGASLRIIGLIHKYSGDKQKALEYSKQALPLHKSVGDIRGEANNLDDLMNIVEEAGNPRLAAFYGKMAVNNLQQVRRKSRGIDKETQKSLLTNVQDAYRTLAHYLINQKRLAEAQEVLNLFKDQEFFDSGGTEQTASRLLTLTPRERNFAELYQQAGRRVEAAGSELNELRRKIGKRPLNADETANFKSVEARFKTAADEFQAILRQAENDFGKPADEKDKIGEIVGLRDMQAALDELSKQTGQKAVAVYTLVGINNFRALVITPDNIFEASQAVNGELINGKAKRLWALLQSDKYDPTKLSQEIYDVVFKPVEDKLPKDTTTIMWSLDGNLRYIPPAALYDGSKYLIERYNHVVFTRADKERLTRAVSPVWTGTGFGSSQALTVKVLGEKISFSGLPGVNEELSAVFKQNNSNSGTVGGSVLSDAQFTKTSFLESLKLRRPVVHIASHFSFRPGDEARSFLLLGDGTTLTLEEMKNQGKLFDGVELLTLSACNTGAQQAGGIGREVDAFSELAQRLGAGAVMATLWAVADNSTPQLMREFYKLKLTNKLTKAEAMRQAQVALLRNSSELTKSGPAQTGLSPVKIVVVKTPEDKQRQAANTRSDIIYIGEHDAVVFAADKSRPFAHPYFWAPFILVGNWR